MKPSIAELGRFRKDFSTDQVDIYAHRYNSYYTFIFPQEEVDISTPEKINNYLTSLGFYAEFCILLNNCNVLAAFELRRLEDVI